MQASPSLLRSLSNFTKDCKAPQTKHALQRVLPSELKTKLFLEEGLSLSQYDDLIDAQQRKFALSVFNSAWTEAITLDPPTESGFVIIKSTRLCNLRCTYCSAWRAGAGQKMSFDVLAQTIIGALSPPNPSTLDFVWHGGEATLLGIDYYRRALWLQETFNVHGKSISNSIQTNGMYLNDEWVKFLRHHRFGVGVSVDGPRDIHDSRRKTIRGDDTYKSIMKNIKLGNYILDIPVMLT